ncbi:MAG: YerC/YecD family TrpR-related protein [Saccharofermentanales bacterium]|jgi:TrpR-related protein YerC/YecD
MHIDSLKDKTLDNLFNGILALKTIEECYQFFDDLCTANEIIALKQRFQVATLIKQGKTYSEIEQITGASSATISRVRRALEYGSDGYNTIIDRLNG